MKKKAAGSTEANDLFDALSSGDPLRRAAAAHELASRAVAPKGADKRLAQQIAKERDEHAKASAILALGRVAASKSSREHTDLFVQLTGVQLDRGKMPPPLVRLAGALALAWTHPLRVDTAMIALLEKNQKKRVPAKKLPFNAGDVGALIREALASLAVVDVDAVRSEMKALMRVHRRKGTRARKEWPREVIELWSAILFRVMRPFDGRKTDEPVPSELDATQRAVLELGVTDELPMVLIDQGLEFPLPPWHGGRETWRRYLGMDPPGPLDLVLTLRHEGKARNWPLWKWFRLLMRKKVGRDVLARELRKKLSAAELVDLGRDATTLIYGAYGEGYGKKPSARSSLLAELLAELGPQAEGSDVEGIAYVLEMLGEGRMLKLEDRRWRGGPFEPKTKKKTEPAKGATGRRAAK